MNVLLLSMPDSFEHWPMQAIRFPNAALSSLAGNVDNHHNVAIADLILVQRRVRSTIERLVQEFEPDLVGLSVMTFQRKTALKTISLIRALRPRAKVVVGGYDPSLAPEAYTNALTSQVDFVVRGEGELTFRELLRAIENGGGYEDIAGLTYRDGDDFLQNPQRGISHLDGDEIRPPERHARVLKGYTLFGRQVDLVETSRGCTHTCSFCSVIAMRGRNFETYSFERILDDIRDARDGGARTIFIVDDNIMLNVKRFEALCHAIIRAKLNDLVYHVQAMTSPLANHGERLAPLMRKAGFRYVFLGIENILQEGLDFLNASAKNRKRENGRPAGNATVKAIEYLHANKMYVIGGLIVGNPQDTPESIQTNLEFAKTYVDWPYIQHPTPYPGTPMTRDFVDRNMIVNFNVEEYDGTTAVVQNETMSAEEMEFMRWRIERWIKLRHTPALFKHHPWFVLRSFIKIFLHTFRGSSLKTFLGLEDEYSAFQRFRAIRRAEREYL